MVNLGLFVRLEAKPGKEAELEEFLKSGLALVEEEPETTVWFAIRMNQSTFGIFDAFANQSGRQAHLNGKLAAALMAKAAELLAKIRSSKTLMCSQQSCRSSAFELLKGWQSAGTV